MSLAADDEEEWEDNDDDDEEEDADCKAEEEEEEEDEDATEVPTGASDGSTVLDRVGRLDLFDRDFFVDFLNDLVTTPVSSGAVSVTSEEVLSIATGAGVIVGVVGGGEGAASDPLLRLCFLIASLLAGGDTAGIIVASTSSISCFTHLGIIPFMNDFIDLVLIL